MTNRVAAPIAELAQNLARVRTGADSTQEIVRWLRAMVPVAASVPMPSKQNVHRRYTRTLLHRCDDFEILVLHWLPGCASAIHDHGGARCWLAVASGAMGVENYLRLDSGSTPGHARIELDHRELLGAGAVDYRNDDVHLHRCAPTGSEPVVSLHVYANPIGRFNTFDERAQTCAEVISSYDAVLTG